MKPVNDDDRRARKAEAERVRYNTDSDYNQRRRAYAREYAREYRRKHADDPKFQQRGRKASLRYYRNNRAQINQRRRKAVAGDH